MARALLLILLLAVAGGAVWWVARDGDVEPPDIGAYLPDTTDPDSETSGLRTEEAAELAGAPPRGPRPPRGPKWPVVSTDRIPRGSLSVIPLRPDDTPYEPGEVRVRLEREQTPFWFTPVGQPDPETRAWRFQKVPIGRVRVIVSGPQVLRTIGRAEIRADKEVEVKVSADRGGLLRFKATYYSGEAPTSMQLELRDKETGQPVEVYWQAVTEAGRDSEKHARRVRIGPQGEAFAIPAGRYVLHAESDAGELDLVPVEIGIGGSAEIEIQLRR